MPLPALFLPIVLAGGSAAIQAASKVRAHRKLTQLHQQLEEARLEHVQAIERQYERQLELSAALGLPEPPLPVALVPPSEPEPENRLRSTIRSKLRFRRKATLLDRRPSGTSAFIVGRHGASFAASTVWKTSSGSILRFLQPISARALTFMPRFASAGGGLAGPIAVSTGVRFVLGAVSIVGLVLGPALAVWTVLSEYRKVKKARAELAAALAGFQAELDAMHRQTAEWESRLASETAGD